MKKLAPISVTLLSVLVAMLGWVWISGSSVIWKINAPKYIEVTASELETKLTPGQLAQIALDAMKAHEQSFAVWDQVAKYNKFAALILVSVILVQAGAIFVLWRRSNSSLNPDLQQDNAAPRHGL